MKSHATGFGGPKGKQAQDAFQDAEPKGAGGSGDNFPTAGAGDGGKGPILAKGGNRDHDIRKGSKD